MGTIKGSNQKPDAGPVIMDGRKFLGAINAGIHTKLARAESLVRQIGQQINESWRLVSLNGSNMIIESVTQKCYYSATYNRTKGGNISIDGIRPIRIVENKKKSTMFEGLCQQMVKAIKENNQADMASIFNKMAGQRFTGRSIPMSGLIRTHDNMVRSVPVSSDSKLVDESVRPRLVSAIVEGLANRVTLRNGIPVGGSTSNFKMPISEWACRKAVARRIRTVAESAYWMPGFQERIHTVAALIAEDKIDKAVKYIGPFLAEYQEFTTLNRRQLTTLVENALATRACFNPQLCRDTATLVWRTNLKVNRSTVVESWHRTAKLAEHPTLLENVRILKESKDFEAAYDKFITLVFNEAVTPNEVQADAYKTALKALRDMPKIKESDELASKITELIERLDDREADHAVIAEVEDLLAEVKGEMDALDTLDDFDEMPGDGGATTSIGGGKEGSPVVNFNINISGDGVSTDTGSEEEPHEISDLLGDDEGEEGGEDEDFGLNDEEEEPEDEEEGDEDLDLEKLLSSESKSKRKKPIKEHGPGERWMPSSPMAGGYDPAREAEHDARSFEEATPCNACGGSKIGPDGMECMECSMEPMADMFSGDPYAVAGMAESTSRTGIGADYGTKPIRIAEDCMAAVNAMVQIIEDEGLDQTQILARAPQLAVSCMEATGIVVPAHRRDMAIEQVCDAFFEELDRRNHLIENQRKGPWRHVWGRKKAAIGRKEGPKSESRNRRAPVTESLSIIRTENDGTLCEMNGVKFIVDHMDPPVVLSEDGQQEVSIPPALHKSALAAVHIAEGNPQPFLEWIADGLEQLRPETAEEAQALNEAIVKVTMTPDGQMNVELDSNDPGMMVTEPEGDGGIPGEEMMPPTGDITPMDDMAPVDDMPAGIEGEGGEEAMPDFEEPVTDEGGEGGEGGNKPPFPPAEGGESEAEEEAEEEAEGGESEAEEEVEEEEEAEEEAEEEGVTEDNDVTTPKSKGYNTTTQDHRKMPKPKKPKKAGTTLSGISTKAGGADGGTNMKKIKK